MLALVLVAELNSAANISSEVAIATTEELLFVEELPPPPVAFVVFVILY